MKPTFKPYRLINERELAWLQETFDHTLQQWNTIHAMYPLLCKLDRSPIQSDCAQPDYLSVIKHSLFGDDSSCFNNLAETLFNELCHQLFGASSTAPQKDWFYIGTPSLKLAFYCADKTMVLYLHPDWVLNALPSGNIPEKPVSTLHQALATQPLSLHVELTPLSLKLSDVMRLNPGDVIKTDHPVTRPASLSHQQTPVCPVDIGQSNLFKSIQITRES